MRTALTTIIFLFSLCQAFTQTVTSDWFFAPGDALESINISNPESFSRPTSGADQIWDYSTISLSQDTVSLNFVEPNTLSTYKDFNTAEVGLEIPGLQEIFYATRNDTFEIVGISTFSPQGLIQIIYEPGESEFLAINPMIFGDEISRDVVGDITLDNSFITSFELNQTISFDGTGTIILPDTTLENCILLTTSVIQEGTEAVRISSIYQNSLVNQVLNYRTDVDLYGVVSTTMTTGILENFLTSVSDLQALNADIYNDIQGNIFIEVRESIDASIQVISADGRVVESHQRLLSSGRNEMSLKSELNSGIYVVLIVDKKTGQFQSHQLSVVR